MPRHGHERRIAASASKRSGFVESRRDRAALSNVCRRATVEAECDAIPVGNRPERRRPTAAPRMPVGTPAPVTLPAPGAGSPNADSNPAQQRHASMPVTSCSRIAGTSASNTRPLRLSRMPGSRRCASRSRPGGGSRPGRIVAVTKQCRHGVECPIGAGSPGTAWRTACCRVGGQPNSGRARSASAMFASARRRTDAMARVVAARAGADPTWRRGRAARSGT